MRGGGVSSFLSGTLLWMAGRQQVAVGSRLGAWSGDRCGSIAPLDVVFAVDDNLVGPDLTGWMTAASIFDPRYALIKFNRLAAECSTGEPGLPLFVNEISPDVCVQRGRLDLTNDNIEARANEFLNQDVRHTGNVLTDDAAPALLAAAGTAFRPGSLRVAGVFTQMKLLFSAEEGPTCRGGTRTPALFYTPFCGSSYAPVTAVAGELRRNEMVLVAFVEESASSEAAGSWGLLAGVAGLVGVPVDLRTGVTREQFRKDARMAVTGMDLKLRCAEPGIDRVDAPLIGDKDPSKVGQNATLRVVLLLDDQYASPAEVNSLPELPLASYAGFRFHKQQLAASSSECFQDGRDDRARCGSPTLLPTNSTLSFENLTVVRRALLPDSDYNVNPAGRVDDLVNAMYGSMLYSYTTYSLARVLVIYTRRYPGAPRDVNSCSTGNTGPNAFTPLCMLEGNGDFDEAWREILERETFVLIAIPPSNDPKDTVDVKKKWEAAIDKIGTVSAKYIAYNMPKGTSLGDTVQFFNDNYLHFNCK